MYSRHKYKKEAVFCVTFLIFMSILITVGIVQANAQTRDDGVHEQVHSVCKLIESKDTKYAAKLKISERVAKSKRNSSFNRCEEDADCVLTSGPCGELVTVNRAHLNCYNEVALIYGASLDCEAPDHLPSKVRCVKSRCFIDSAQGF